MNKKGAAVNRCISFGTDGIRGNTQQFPFTQPDFSLLAHAIALWCNQKYGNGIRILIGHDTRHSCTPLKRSLITALTNAGHHCYDAEVMPTPAVMALLKNTTLFSVGIVISASHNPAEDNGLKIIDKVLGKLDSVDEQAIIHQFDAIKNLSALPAQTAKRGTTQNVSLAMQERYISLICSFFSPDFLRGKTVVLDCANGATFDLAPTIFRLLGAEVILLNAEPSGHNINKSSGTVHPQMLQKKVLRSGADAGFAFDGDGDRVVAVNKHGALLDGDNILALLIDHPVYKHLTTIVGTVLSNAGLVEHCKSRNKIFVRMQVGDRNIGNYLQKNRLLLGGEASGHIIAADYLPSGDGIFAALRVLESISFRNNWSMQTFTHIPQTFINVPCLLRPPLNQSPYQEIIAKHQAQLPNGRVVVRYSGTESVLRVMVEDQDSSLAIATGNELARELEAALSST